MTLEKVKKLLRHRIFKRQEKGQSKYSSSSSVSYNANMRQPSFGGKCVCWWGCAGQMSSASALVHSSPPAKNLRKYWWLCRMVVPDWITSWGTHCKKGLKWSWDTDSCFFQPILRAIQEPWHPTMCREPDFLT